jgi:pilus assembly protein Flp/PilA
MPRNSDEERKMLSHMMRFVEEEDGATAVEYGLMVSLIAATIIAAVTLIGTNMVTSYNTVAGAIAS